MHLVELDTGRMLKAFVLTLFCLLLMIAPLTAQSQQASPTLPPVAASAITETKDVLQTFGIVNVVLLAIVVAVLAIAIIAAWKFVLPLIQSLTGAYQQMTTMNTNNVRMQSESAQAQAQASAQAASERAVHTNALQTLAEAYQAIKPALDDGINRISEEQNTGRGDGVKAVNDHTTEKVDELREPLTQAVAALTSASDNVKTATDTISKVVTSTELKAELKPILDMLDSLGESVGIVLRRLGTGPLNPDAVLPVLPAKAVDLALSTDANTSPSSSTIPGIPLS